MFWYLIETAEKLYNHRWENFKYQIMIIKILLYSKIIK
jgi:hypothetical protein